MGPLYHNTLGTRLLGKDSVHPLFHSAFFLGFFALVGQPMKVLLVKFHVRLSDCLVLVSGIINFVFVWALDKEEFNVFGRIGRVCLLCLVSRYSVTARRRRRRAGHALAPPQGFWKVHISPKCHFHYSGSTKMRLSGPFLSPSSFFLMTNTPESPSLSRKKKS